MVRILTALLLINRNDLKFSDSARLPTRACNPLNLVGARQETRTINALLKYLTYAKSILKIHRTFLSVMIFPFLDFVQQVARYGDFFVFVACILMHEGFLTSQYPLLAPLLAQASFACTF